MDLLVYLKKKVNVIANEQRLHAHCMSFPLFRECRSWVFRVRVCVSDAEGAAQVEEAA
jgi:hypothetical protein